MEIKDAIAILAANVMFACDKAQFSEACKASVEDALIMAISALEKQIPEPPKVAEGNDADGFWRPDMFFCQTCGKVIDTCEHHCICGQKIDWED